MMQEAEKVDGSQRQSVRKLGVLSSGFLAVIMTMLHALLSWGVMSVIAAGFFSATLVLNSERLSDAAPMALTLPVILVLGGVMTIPTAALQGFAHGALFALLYNAAQHWWRKPTLEVECYPPSDEPGVSGSLAGTGRARGPSDTGFRADVDPALRRSAKRMAVWSTARIGLVGGVIQTLLVGVPMALVGALQLWMFTNSPAEVDNPETPFVIGFVIVWMLFATLGPTLGGLLSGATYAWIYNWARRFERMPRLQVEVAAADESLAPSGTSL